MSMLMGMGYKPGDSKSKEKKSDAVEVKRRPVRLGLGAKTMAGEGGVETTAKKAVQRPPPSNAPAATTVAHIGAAPLVEAPAKVKGAFLRARLAVRITKSGSHYNSKCSTVSYDDCYWVVKLDENKTEEIEVKEKYLETIVKRGKPVVVLKDTGDFKAGQVGVVEEKGKETCKLVGVEGDVSLDYVCMLAQP
jgi:hypothetical protein